MRFFADENFPKLLLQKLRLEGHDVLWARPNFIGWSDTKLLDLAESESRIVLTLDKDFRQIAVQRREPLINGGLILFQLHPAIPKIIEPYLFEALESIGEISGQIRVVSASRIEIVRSRRT